MVGAVLLASGAGRRFGSNKLLATLAGRPLLDYTLASIPRACFSQVVAVVSDQAVAELCGKYAPQVCSYQGGPQSESIRRGLATVEGADGCLFVMGDQPLCSADSIRRLLAAFQAQPRAVHRLSYQGKPSSPTLFPAALFPALMHLTGERGGMAARSSGMRTRQSNCPKSSNIFWHTPDGTGCAFCRFTSREK